MSMYKTKPVTLEAFRIVQETMIHPHKLQNFLSEQAPHLKGQIGVDQNNGIIRMDITGSLGNAVLMMQAGDYLIEKGGNIHMVKGDLFDSLFEISSVILP